MRQLEQYIIDMWEETTHNKQKPDRLSFLKLTSGNFASRMVILIFKDNDKSPFLVAKTVQSAWNSHSEKEKLRYEFDNLSALQSLLSPPFDRTVPKPYFLTYIDGNLVLLESSICGTPLNMSLARCRIFRSRRRVSRDFELVKRWLVDFHTQTKTASLRLDDRKVPELITDHIDRYRDIFGVTPAEDRFFQRICARVKQFAGHQIPIVFEHGAFWLGNILLSGDNIGVIDWESSRICSLPFYDLFLFPSDYACRSRTVGWPDDWFRSTIFTHYEKNWFSDIVAQFMRSYCQQMNIDIAFAKLFFSVFLIVKTNRSYERYGCNARETILWRQILELHTRMEQDFIL